MTSYIKASTYFIEGLINSLGAIKRKNFFDSTAVVDALIFDLAVEKLIEWAVIIGSQDSKKARKILLSFNSTFSEEELLNKMRKKWAITCPLKNDPIQAVCPILYHKEYKVIDIPLYQSFNFQVKLAEYCMEGLLWGINYPDSVLTYISKKSDLRYPLEIYNKIDPKITHLPSVSEYIDDSLLIATNYLEEIKKSKN